MRGNQYLLYFNNMHVNIFIIILFIVNSLKIEKKFILIKIHVENMITSNKFEFWLIIIDLLTIFT